MRVCLHGSARAAEQVRDLGFGQVGVVPQHQYGTLPLRQGLERLTHPRAERLPVGELPETMIADFADGQALGARVRQALQALLQRQRAVLVLRYYADLPEAEVADLLGCSCGTVKTHAHRGLRALREILGDELYERHGN